MSPHGLNLERNWRSRLQIESPMRILHDTKANGTYTVGLCIYSTCSGQNSIELGSVPKISTLIFALKLSPFHARNAFYRVKNREILNATNGRIQTLLRKSVKFLTFGKILWSRDSPL